ncbi:Phenolic glucoside malonyltransferase 2 [Camellia lanceoleosa]|uniref:Phenolic glucoside malonyltransferase 2 n=1 Tax=Camellia lanceoleosa TaxID=1840588 RepID=A0ACC0ITA3_9ERIC|nr:Phenolic glucoside malonyltransferase 2 [Camellia lanceoleosa]
MKVVEVCRVTPIPSTATSTSLHLTFFDVFWLRVSPIQCLFFYETSHPSTTFLEEVLPKLKHSLSLTLHHYLPLAGNLTWLPDSDKPITQYVERDDALSLTIAESEADFYYLSSNSSRKFKEIQPFVPNLPASHTRVPVMTLQITLFPNAGFSIGYTTHHGVLDGKTAALFMHSWASICRHSGDSTLMPELTPCYDRSLIDDPNDLERNNLDFVLKYIEPRNKSLMILNANAQPEAMICTFQLTRANIELIKKRVNAQWQKKYKHKLAMHVSTFTITSAYVWVSLVKARKIRTGKVHLGFSVDCRARLEPPIPSTYFGNCISGCFIDADSNDLIGEDGVAMAAKAIGEAIEGLNDGILDGVELAKLPFMDMDRLFSIASSPRFELYKTDFGWGKPKKVEMTSIDKNGAFSLFDSRDGNGGLEIGIMLKKQEIKAFASLFASGLEVEKMQ